MIAWKAFRAILPHVVLLLVGFLLSGLLFCHVRHCSLVTGAPGPVLGGVE